MEEAETAQTEQEKLAEKEKDQSNILRLDSLALCLPGRSVLLCKPIDGREMASHKESVFCNCRIGIIMI